MGVKGLWQLIEPIGRPIRPETLEGQKLAIDSSIWLYHFQMAMRDKTGKTFKNAHILGFLWRILKLLHLGIRPVFVFDGGAPALKRKTLAGRRARKAGAQESHAKTASKLLNAQLREAAYRHVIEQKDKQREAAEATQKRRWKGSDEAVEGEEAWEPDDERYDGDNSVEEALRTGLQEDLGGNVVYFDDLMAPNAGSSTQRGAHRSASRPPLRTSASPSKGDETPDEASPNKARKKDWHKDPYALPPLEANLSTIGLRSASRANGGDVSKAKFKRPKKDFRYATESELRAMMSSLRPEDLSTTSPFFSQLPVALQYELVGDMRAQSRGTSYKRLQSMIAAAPTAADFSKQQVLGLKTRNDWTQRVLEVTDQIGSANIKVNVITDKGRIAGSRGKEYVLVRNEKDGGFVLGRRAGEGGTKEKAIDLEELERGQRDDELIGSEDEENAGGAAKRRRLASGGEARHLNDVMTDEEEYEEVSSAGHARASASSPAKISSTDLDNVSKSQRQQLATLLEDGEFDVFARKEVAMQLICQRAKAHAKQGRREAGVRSIADVLDDEEAWEEAGRARGNSTRQQGSRLGLFRAVPVASRADGAIDIVDSDDELREGAEEVAEWENQDALFSDILANGTAHLALPNSVPGAVQPDDDDSLDDFSADLYEPALEDRQATSDVASGVGGPQELKEVTAFEEVEGSATLRISSSQSRTSSSTQARKHLVPIDEQPQGIYGGNAALGFRYADRAGVPDRLKNSLFVRDEQRRKDFEEDLYVSERPHASNSPGKSPSKNTSTSARPIRRSSSTIKTAQHDAIARTIAPRPTATGVLESTFTVKQAQPAVASELVQQNCDTPAASGDASHGFFSALAALQTGSSPVSPTAVHVIKPSEGISSRNAGVQEAQTGPVDKGLNSRKVEEDMVVIAKRQPEPGLTDNDHIHENEDVREDQKTRFAEVVPESFMEGPVTQTSPRTAAEPAADDGHNISSSSSKGTTATDRPSAGIQELSGNMTNKHKAHLLENPQAAIDLDEIAPDSETEQSHNSTNAFVFSPNVCSDDEKGNENENEPESRQGSVAASPEPVMLGADGFPLPTLEELDAADEDDEDLEGLVQRETQGLASILKQQQQPSGQRNKTYRQMQAEAETEVNLLKEQHAASRRTEEDVTLQMALDVQYMLRQFGIPYITGPMEAEAQCAELVRLGLCDGIITDDSDVFLFGGMRVFKNMFNDNKTVQCFVMNDLDRNVGLDRRKLIQLAHLLGSDYTDGLDGVGIVLAMEILSIFSGEDGLIRFRDWWLLAQQGADKDYFPPGDWDAGERKEIRSRLSRIKKTLIKKVHLTPEWPDTRVAEAYLEPQVDHSEEPFAWGVPDLEQVRQCLMHFLGWSVEKCDQYVLPVFEQMHRRGRARGQTTLGDGFFDNTAGLGHYAPRERIQFGSTRLQQVINGFRASEKGKVCVESKMVDSDESSVEAVDANGTSAPRADRGKRKRSGGRGSASAARSSARSTASARGRKANRSKGKGGANAATAAQETRNRSDFQEGNGGQGDSSLSPDMEEVTEAVEQPFLRTGSLGGSSQRGRERGARADNLNMARNMSLDDIHTLPAGRTPRISPDGSGRSPAPASGCRP
ncbi:PIN domain-like protein [Tilletiaria anomala UBC 951]|uniref:PIN domain-like protein n=1 Tax=Tilletiaria anomala (strain ATCC 24038 / CBS 436.72 / UBC 951) TaxID=1037660 RepID=A0A066VR68_TILAU|nr:PIN domain-like protein [Tilletiaria anomala UBC 951]KDN43946.1 PIN domain-like protein [Tilletiaria anomala UBC 951]